MRYIEGALRNRDRGAGEEGQRKADIRRRPHPGGQKNVQKKGVFLPLKNEVPDLTLVNLHKQMAMRSTKTEGRSEEQGEDNTTRATKLLSDIVTQRTHSDRFCGYFPLNLVPGCGSHEDEVLPWVCACGVAHFLSKATLSY